MTHQREQVPVPMNAIATVVIPTYQRPDLLRECLASVERARLAVGQAVIDVVVTDDSRDDQSKHLVETSFKNVRYVRGPQRGPASNRNCGAALATGRWLVFMDDDCIADEGWLQGYLSAFASHPDQQLFEGRTRADRPRKTYAEESPVNETGGHLWSCNMAITADLFKRLEGFCESFPHPALEDVDLRLRLESEGFRPVFAPAASVCHPYRPMRELAFFRKHTASYAHLLSLHPKLVESLTWLGIATDTARMLFSLVKNVLRYGFAGSYRITYATLAKARVDATFLLARAQDKP